MNSSVIEFIRKEVPDWDDEVVSRARFKAFSGQRSDWEPMFLFWRDLILKLARHLGLFIIQTPEVKNNWFNRGGLIPLCIDRVLLEMYNAGDILQMGDLVDPTSGHLSQLFKRVVRLMGVSRSPAPKENSEDHLILVTLLQERAAEVIKLLSETHWTSFCIITMGKFQSICKGSSEASAILSYFSGCGKAQYLSTSKSNFIEGVKISLVPAAVSSISSLDCDVLHLLWTTEKLQQQLDVTEQRCEMSRKLATASLKSGNKKAALRHARQLKLAYEHTEKCTTLLNRVEEVLSIIANAESTKKVSEAIQIGARAIKENGISVEEVQLSLQELDESVALQKQVEEALESTPYQYTCVDDEDVEEEFTKLELELGVETQEIPILGTVVDRAKNQESTESLCSALSNLMLADDAAKVEKSMSNNSSKHKLEAA